MLYVTQNLQQPTAFELLLSHSQVAVVKVALPILIFRPEIGFDLGWACLQVFPIAASWLFFSSSHVFLLWQMGAAAGRARGSACVSRAEGSALTEWPRFGQSGLVTPTAASANTCLLNH